MDINELNTKLVSELREIAKVLGIADSEKLRKQELIDRISEIAKESQQDDSAETVDVDADKAGERTRKRVRTVKVAEPVAVGRTRVTSEEDQTKIEFTSKPADPVASESPTVSTPEPAPKASTRTDFDNVIVNEGVLEIMADGYGFL